jgi:phage I-like protein
MKDNPVSTVVHAIAPQLPAEELPGEIQYLPPGTHKITAHRDGKPHKMTVKVDADSATKLADSIKALLAAGEEPFIDFNHDDKSASGWLKDLFWAGDDPKTGGVRAKVEWTQEGATALKGKGYKRFSPTFTVNEQGVIDGTRVNAGGLVNRPAFTRIAKIVAKASEEDSEDAATNPEENSMDQKEHEAAIQAKDAEIADLRKQVETLNAKAAEFTANRITSLIEAACGDGRIPAKDEEAKKQWTATLTACPESEALLAKLPKTVMAKGIVGGKVPGSQSATVNLDDPEEVYQAQQTILAKHATLPFAERWTAACGEAPELFGIGKE